MFAIVLLALLACEGVTSFKFIRSRNYNGDVNYFNGHGSNFDFKFLIRQKVNIFRKKENLGREIESIYKQKEALDKRIEYLNKQKERLDEEIEKIDKEMEKFNPIHSPDYEYSRYPDQSEGNEFIINMPLPGYIEEEITVKVKNRRLEINAIHNVPDEPVTSYTHVMDLPDNIDPKGSWSYQWGVLRVIFPSMQNKYSPNFMNPFFKVFTEQEVPYNENPTTSTTTTTTEKDVLKDTSNDVFENYNTTSKDQNSENSRIDDNATTTTYVHTTENNAINEEFTAFTKPGNDIETTPSTDAVI